MDNCAGMIVNTDTHRHAGHCLLLSYAGSDIAADAAAVCPVGNNVNVLMRNPNAA